MNFKVVVRECNPVPPDLSVDRFDEIEHRRLLLLKSANLRHRLITLTSVIVRHVSNLFRVHSNLVAVEPCWMGGEVRIRFLVSCKHYVPDGERELPVGLDCFRTCVQQGWFRLTGLCGGLSIQTCLKPGCAVSAEQTSGRDGGLSTFGTVGGYVTMNGTSFAITVGHLFRTSAAVPCIDTYPAGSSVIANPELAQLMCRYFGEDIGERTDFLALCEEHSWDDIYRKLRKACALSQKDTVSAIVSCGTLVGCQLPVIARRRADVAVIRVDGPAVPFDSNGLKMCSMEGISIPSLEIKLDDNFQPTNTELLGPDVAIGREAHGYGAFASADMNIRVMDNYVTFLKDVEGNHFQCVRGQVYGSGRSMKPGDSGTWFWCDDSTLLGMGIGTEGNDAMIIPMTDVVAAVIDIVQSAGY